MKTQFVSHRPLVMGNDWMIVAGHPLASQAGAAILQEGGTAVDAAIAANAVLGVVRPHMNGLGGDLFALVYMAQTGQLKALNASGRSPYRASCETYTEMGLDRIPPKGVLSATVPGVVDGWAELIRKYGCMDLDRLLRRAIDLAEIGFPVYRELTWFIEKWAETLKRSAAAEKVFFSRGRAPVPGERLVQSDLAKSLKKIAETGRDVFYRGELGETLIDFSNESGGLFSIEDMADHRSTWHDPIQTDYRGYTLCTHPPNSQGIAWPMIANIVENCDLAGAGHNTADYVHQIVEATKLAFADRDRYVCDPEFHHVPVERMLEKDYARKQFIRLSKEAAATPIEPTDFSSSGEDTVYLAVVDQHGNAVSLIQSLYEPFGSGTMIDGTGILLHNRGRDFRLDTRHINCLEPHKRPYHTLTPAMILKGEHPFAVLGSPGADGQTQTLMQVTCNLIEFGADPQEAVEAARWRYNPDNSISIEDRFPGETINGLKAKGHQLNIRSDWDAVCGGAQVILIDRENHALFAGADPRRQGYAIGH
ncbi:MAG: gamma-glutamyltransferase [Deltaproteobacteria bacterium]|nr:gamma-glutamyltransferase [Deltaproteobacteria bacterium]